MQLGYLTGFSEEECETAARIGYDCLEVQAGWELEDLQDEDYRKGEGDRINRLLQEHGLSISAVAVYHAIPAPVSERADAYKTYIRFCAELGVEVITSLTKCDPANSLEQNLEEWEAVFAEVAPSAEDAGIRIGFENWPGLRGNFPPVGTINFAFHPHAWEQMFERVPSPSLGLEFDPSHFVWQGVDWAAVLREWIDRVHHVHAKDTEIFEDRLKSGGFFSGGWWRYRLPGYGRVDWHKFTSVLKEEGYDGAVCLEHEDGVFLGDRRTEGLQKAYNVLRPLV
ncbi:MAG: sugar phosphate isomerase/epimerase family protein [Planctomycetota bacterium]